LICTADLSTVGNVQVNTNMGGATGDLIITGSSCLSLFESAYLVMWVSDQHDQKRTLALQTILVMNMFLIPR
jgi:hypothetical protein